MREDANINEVPNPVPEYHTNFLAYRSLALAHDLVEAGKNAGCLHASDPSSAGIFANAVITGQRNPITKEMERVAHEYCAASASNPVLQGAVLKEAYALLQKSAHDHLRHAMREKPFRGVRRFLYELDIPIQPRLTIEHKQHDLERAFLLLAMDVLEKCLRTQATAFSKSHPDLDYRSFAQHASDTFFRIILGKSSQAGKIQANVSGDEVPEVTGDSAAIRQACQDEVTAFMTIYAKNRPIRGAVLSMTRKLAEGYRVRDDLDDEGNPVLSSLAEKISERILRIVRLPVSGKRFSAYKAVNQHFYGIILDVLDGAIREQNKPQ